jgi:hypothetical protein
MRAFSLIASEIFQHPYTLKLYLFFKEQLPLFELFLSISVTGLASPLSLPLFPSQFLQELNVKLETNKIKLAVRTTNVFLIFSLLFYTSLLLAWI